MVLSYTIATNKFLPQAYALASSFIEHNNDCKFIIALLDTQSGIEKYLTNPAIEIIEIHKMGISHFEMLKQRYNAFEMCCALKPFVAEYLQREKNSETIIYLDSDILVFNNFSLLKELRSYSFIITPHCVSPEYRNDNHFFDLSLIKEGLYNAGFFAFNTSNPESKQILKWWMHKLETECFVNTKKGQYVDQTWLNFLPIYFNEVFVLKNWGYNVAIWNLCERTISQDDKAYYINNDPKTPLVFFHFSGYNFERPHIASANHSSATFESRKDMKLIFDFYYQKLLSEGIQDYKPVLNYYKNIEHQPNVHQLNDSNISSQNPFKHFLTRVLRKLISYLS